MAMLQAWAQAGPTRAINVTTTAQAVPVTTDVEFTENFRVVNAGTTTVFLVLRAKSSDALSALTIPVDGTPAFGIPMVPGAVEIISGPRPCFAGVVTAAGTSVVYITPGSGI